jgi:penicillin amidase
MSLVKKILRISFYCLIAFIATLFILLFGSYPTTSGSKQLSCLKDPVRIERDAQGIPTIFAKNRLDVARATGFVHAQDRFFQMDILRRMPSGELSEIFGPAALNFDKERKFHSFRNHARTVLVSLSSSERQLLQAYTEGVNAGLSSLYVRPFEYLLLRETPRAWTEEDSVLVGLELYFSL